MRVADVPGTPAESEKLTGFTGSGCSRELRHDQVGAAIRRDRDAGQIRFRYHDPRRATRTVMGEPEQVPLGCVGLASLLQAARYTRMPLPSASVGRSLRMGFMKSGARERASPPRANRKQVVFFRARMVPVEF